MIYLCLPSAKLLVLQMGGITKSFRFRFPKKFPVYAKAELFQFLFSLEAMVKIVSSIPST